MYMVLCEVHASFDYSLLPPSKHHNQQNEGSMGTHAFMCNQCIQYFLIFTYSLFSLLQNLASLQMSVRRLSLLIASFCILCTIMYLFSNSSYSRYHIHHPYDDLKEVDLIGVQRFVFFIGYPRTGHSIIGSFMDAHPNMIIAHEYPLFESLGNHEMTMFELFNELHKNSVGELKAGWRGQKNVDKKGYSLSLEGLWQATFTKLKVIGNKYGGATLTYYRDNPDAFLSLMEQLKGMLGIPISIIHVVRNPYDIIATHLLYVDGRKTSKLKASVDNKYNHTTHLKELAEDMAERADVAADMLRVLKLPFLEVHHEEFINDPISVMKQICVFVGVKCTEHYLSVCKSHTYSSPSKSRNVVVWTDEIVDYVRRHMLQHSFMNQYSFDD